MVPSGRVAAWVTRTYPGGGRHGESKSWPTNGSVQGGRGLESGSMSERWPGSACEAAVPGEWWLADGDPSRFVRGRSLRVVLPGRKFHSHPALLPGRLIEHHKAKVKENDSNQLTTRRELNNKVLDYSKMKSESITKYNIQYDSIKDLYY